MRIRIYRRTMPADLNHTIVPAADPEGAARDLATMLDLPAPSRFGPFWVLTTTNGASLDFVRADGEVRSLHFAFLVSEEQFDATFERIVARGLDHYADPAGSRPREINTNDGGRGVYWPNADGHWLEIITVPYGGWPYDR